jgi:hypothetical protein
MGYFGPSIISHWQKGKGPGPARTPPLSSRHLYRKPHFMDNDASSVTSTVSERYDSEPEFTVDRILAEKNRTSEEVLPDKMGSLSIREVHLGAQENHSG